MPTVTLTKSWDGLTISEDDFNRIVDEYRFMLSTLKSIIEWQDCPTTRPEAKELLIRNAVRSAIEKAKAKNY